MDERLGQFGKGSQARSLLRRDRPFPFRTVFSHALHFGYRSVIGGSTHAPASESNARQPPSHPIEGGSMDRRTLLRSTMVGVGGLALPFTAWSAAYAAPAQNAAGPYGPLQAADANGIQLPAGFTSQLIARSGQAVLGTSYVWHNAPDGGAVIPNAGRL